MSRTRLRLDIYCDEFTSLVEMGYQEALRDVNCIVKLGKLTGIFGPNGAGKSTLMKAMLSLVIVSSGTVLCEGRPLMQQLEKVLCTTT